MSRTAATAVIAWLVAVAGAITIGLLAVGAIGTGIVGPTQKVLTPAEVDARLAAATRPPPATMAPPSPGTTPEVLAPQGGTILARCVDGRVEVVSVTPAQGYRVDDDGGPGRIKFEAEDIEIEVQLTCQDGRPVANATIVDD